MAGVRAWQEKARLESLGGRGTNLLTSRTGAQEVRLGFWDKAETRLAALVRHWSDNRAVEGPETEQLGCSKPSLQIGVGSRGPQLDPQGPVGWEEKAEAGKAHGHISFFRQNTVQR